MGILHLFLPNNVYAFIILKALSRYLESHKAFSEERGEGGKKWRLMAQSFCRNPSNISDTDRNPFANTSILFHPVPVECCGLVNSLNQVVWVKIYNCHLGRIPTSPSHTIDFKDTSNLSAICCFMGGRFARKRLRNAAQQFDNSSLYQTII
jgi:hypothetical protein